MPVPTTCVLDGCVGPVLARGWCSKHYQRWWKYGDPLTTTRIRDNNGWENDLAARVDRRGPDECWPWTGPTHKGYGCLHGVRVHRVAYRLAFGDIPDGLQVDHTCHNRDETCKGGSSCPHRRCCNPRHLEAVTTAQNVLRGKSLRAVNARKSECLRGHPFDAVNTYVRSNGRHCKQCALYRQRLRRARLRERRG